MNLNFARFHNMKSERSCFKSWRISIKPLLSHIRNYNMPLVLLCIFFLFLWHSDFCPQIYLPVAKNGVLPFPLKNPVWILNKNSSILHSVMQCNQCNHSCNHIDLWRCRVLCSLRWRRRRTSSRATSASRACPPPASTATGQTKLAQAVTASPKDFLWIVVSKW